MKKVSIIMLCLMLGVSMWAQGLSVQKKTYGSGYSLNVIQPTIDNFIKLVEMSDSEFESCMKYYGYFLQENQGSSLFYWNGSLDNYAYAKAVNSFYYNLLSNEITYMVSKEYIYPSTSITDLIKSLRPYYYARKALFGDEMSDVFKIERNGKVYAIFVTDRGSMYDIRIMIFAS